jgi:DNA-binding CsgD family transcriptional regulator
MEPKVTASNAIACAILDEMRVPVFVVGSEAELKFSNAAGRAELKAGESFKDVDGVLVSVHPAENARLQSAIAVACEKNERQTITINDARNPRPQLVSVLPFHADDAASKCGSLIFVQKCEPKDEAFLGALRQLFRLSAAEVDIAAALVSGGDVEQIAEMRNAKITTVRTQIAAMLLKTRTRRQGELIALFSRICTLP